MLIVMPPMSSAQRGHCAIRRSSIDPVDIEMRIAAITVLQRQDEIDDKSNTGAANTTRGSPTSFTGRIVPHFPGEDYPADHLSALTTVETQSIYAVEDNYATSSCGGITHASMCTLTPTGPVIEAQKMQLHAMRHYPLIDQHYFSQQECYLNKNVLRWEFDVLKLEESSAQGVLKDVGLKLVEVHGLMEEFQLSLVPLHQTFQLIQASYHNNPYHNAAHAADVVQAACCLIAEQKITKHMTKLEHLAMIMAGACHDLDHPGVNQAFLKTTNHYLTEAAKRYPKTASEQQQSSLDENNVMSVLEIHHIRHAVAIFDQTQVFAHFKEDTYLELLRLIRELILATDMAYQSRYMEKLKRLNKEYLGLESQAERDVFFKDEEKRRFYLQISLKCADICNTCRPWEISRKWSRRVTEEFFAQGDKERVLSLPINEINDRTRTTIEKVQVGFLKFVARPLFAEWDSIHRSFSTKALLYYIDDNLRHWNEAQREIDLRSQTSHVAKEPSTAATHLTAGSSKSSRQHPVPTEHTDMPNLLKQMQSHDSLLEPHRVKPQPPDVIADTGGVVRLEIAGEANVDDADDILVATTDLKERVRKPSFPCAFVSLDHSVAIIQDNLRLQQQEKNGNDQEALSVGNYKFTMLEERTNERDTTTLECKDNSAAAVLSSSPGQRTESCNSDPPHLDLQLKHIESVCTMELPDRDREALGCFDAPLDLPKHHPSSPTFSVYSQFKPRPHSEILETVPSIPSPADSNSEKNDANTCESSEPPAHHVCEVVATDAEAELLHRLKYEPFSPHTLAEIEKLSPDQRKRLDLLSKQDQMSPGDRHLSRTVSDDKHQSASSDTGLSTVPEKSSTTTGSVDNPDLNSYARWTSPPPYRKSIMLTVDKSLEKLRENYAKSLKSAHQSTSEQGASLECVKATQVTVFESATLYSPKTHKSPSTDVGEQESNRSETPSFHGGPPPKRTTSAKSENILPSSVAAEILMPESLTPGYSSMSSMASPELSRRKINQSRSRFFQSLLPSSLNLKSESQHRHSTGVPANWGGSDTVSSSPNTSATVSHSHFLSSNASSPRSPDLGIKSQQDLSSDTVTQGLSASPDEESTQSNKQKKIMFRLPSFPALNRELEALNSPLSDEKSASPCNITTGDCETAFTTPDTTGVLKIQIEGEDYNPERRQSRSTVPDTLAAKSAKRSQSASARLAKTFQRFFGSNAGSSKSGNSFSRRSPRDVAPTRGKMEQQGSSNNTSSKPTYLTPESKSQSRGQSNSPRSSPSVTGESKSTSRENSSTPRT